MSAQYRCDGCGARMSPYGAGGTTCEDCREGRPPKSETVFAEWYLDELAAKAAAANAIEPARHVLTDRIVRSAA